MEVQAPPPQALMHDSLQTAMDESGGGASLQNKQSSMMGDCYGACCFCCAACGCAANLTTISQGYVGVVMEFGKYTRTLPPGRHVFNIMTEKVVPVNLRTVCLDIPAQSLITKDNLTVMIDAVCFYKVFDAPKAAFSVENYSYALGMLAQVTIRTVLGEMLLSEVLGERKTINARLGTLIDERTDPWGIKVDRVELKEIRISDQMQRAMGAKAEAVQEAEAKIIQATAQRDAASILSEAAKAMSSEPNAFKLQWFETLRIISTQGRNTTIIVPDNIEPATAMAAKALTGSLSQL